MTFSETFLVFLVILVVFLGVKFGFRKSCLCKKNDKYQVCDGYDHGDHYDEMDDEDEDIVTQQICPGSDIYFPPKYRKIGTRKGNLLRKKI